LKKTHEIIPLRKKYSLTVDFDSWISSQLCPVIPLIGALGVPLVGKIDVLSNFINGQNGANITWWWQVVVSAINV
jgi:hypothetical protein